MPLWSEWKYPQSNEYIAFFSLPRFNSMKTYLLLTLKDIFLLWWWCKYLGFQMQNIYNFKLIRQYRKQWQWQWLDIFTNRNYLKGFLLFAIFSSFCSRVFCCFPSLKRLKVSLTAPGRDLEKQPGGALGV